jgi:hypothetical protein
VSRWLRSLEKHFQEGTAEPQISPLRFASVEMTKGRAVLPGRVVAGKKSSGPQPPFPLSSRPERTRISYFALLPTTTYAVFLKKTA